MGAHRQGALAISSPGLGVSREAGPSLQEHLVALNNH